MRNARDINGHAVHVESVTAESAFAGMIEGNPFLDRKWRVLTGNEWMKQPGRLVHGLDAIARELAQMDVRHSVWADNERWEARIVDDIDFGAWTQRVLLLRWYQQGGDPMARLQEIIESFDFCALAVTVPVEKPD